MISQLVSLLIVTQLIVAAPIPAVITRYHTADAVTTTQTYTTGTTTVFLPPVELLISDGVSYTFTLSSEQWNTTPLTKTITYNNAQRVIPTPAATQDAQLTAEVSTPQTSATTPQTSQQTTEQTTPQTTEQTTPQTTEQTTPQTTEQAQQTTVTEQTTPQTTEQAQQTTEIEQATTLISQAPQSTHQTTPQAPQAAQPATTQSTLQTVSTQSPSSTNKPAPTNGGSGISPPSTIVYSPYADDGSCKSISAIDSDLELISSKGIKKIRVYGTDCNNFSGILPKCVQLGITVNQGVWFNPSGGVSSIDQSISDIISYGSANGWSVFDFITVGNEAINDNYLSVSQLIGKIASVKLQLQGSGYNGKIATSEPPVSFQRNPSLCSAVDIVGINPHSYFDSGVDASQAGSFVMGQKAIVQGVCGLKEVIITETGYPSQGNTNGLNVPSTANQKIAIESLIQESGGDLTILTTYNDLWKDPGPNGIEQYFGVITLLA